jgi:GntR family transcriptional regulator, transcriptional repressor for pyruvate dehydrogenase complex
MPGTRGSQTYNRIVDQLLEQINTGILKPGDRLPPERELAEIFSVSRTVIREATRTMEYMGFLQSKVGNGTFVRQVTFDKIIDPFQVYLTQDEQFIMELIEIRLLLETEIARLAAQRASAADKDRIAQALDMMEHEIISGDNGLTGENAFHDALASAAKNTAIIKILSMCNDLISKTCKVTLDIPGHSRVAWHEHKMIFEAIEHGDAKKAVAEMRKHLKKAYEYARLKKIVIR